ncbi:MAG: PDZ domain-containing protein, partial [Gemmatimonadota bacterium]|nr:PDZ domain-containing protein [Gemmatimonadota bacterium]
MSTFRVLVVVTGLVVLGVSASALDDLVRHGGARGYFGWTEAPTPPPPSAFRVVESVDPSGPAAGRLQPGDRLVSLDGDTLVARFGTAYVRTTEPVGWRYSIRILRGGQELEYQLSSVAGRRRLAYPWSMFFTSLVWCAVGLFIGFAKPDDGVARVAFAAAVATGLVFLQSGATPQHLPGGIHQPLHFALGYHFFFRFPGGIDRGKVSRTLLWAFYVVAAFTFVVRQPLTWLYYTQGPGATAAWAAEHAALLKWSWALALALMVPVVTAALVLLASTYSRVTDRQ